MFVGGTDAAAASVIWAMTHLMKNPGTMKKAQEETRNIIGKMFNSYLEAVVKETLRLEPPARLIRRDEKRQRSIM